MPNRIIKEAIRTSRSVNGLSDFNFRVWVYLITYADDFGRGSADPELLKGMVFPRLKAVTEDEIDKALQDIADADMIELYEVDGERYFEFPNWSKHQCPRAKISKFPAPCKQMQADASTCEQMLCINDNDNDNYKRKRITITYTGTNTGTANINSEEQRERIKLALKNMEA